MNKNKTILSSTIAALIWSAPGLAQTSAPADPASQGAFIETVVVTAEKRSANLQETPLAITAITAETIEQKGITSVLDLAAIAPNLNITPGASSTTNITVFIRGIGDSEQILSNDSPVGLYVDGVVIGRSTGAAFDILDLERIEVLRGPQGTLYGRNTIGGAVNLITAKPADDFGGNVQASYGDLGYAQGKATIDTGKLGNSNVSARVTYVHKQRDGYVDNVLASDSRDPGAYDLDAFRSALRYEGEALTVDYGFDHSQRDSHALPFQLTIMRPDVADYLAASSALGGSPPLVSDRFLDKFALDPNGEITDEVTGHTVTANLDIGDITVRSITGYREWEGTNRLAAVPANAGLVGFTVSPAILAPPYSFIPLGVTPVQLFEARNDRKQDQWSQEFNVLGKIGDDFEYVLGAYFFDENASEDNPTSFLYLIPSPAPIPLTPTVSVDAFGVQIPSLLSYEHESESQAVFAQGTYALTERLNMTAGLRYTEDDKNLVQFSPAPSDKSASFSESNYALGLDYQFSDDVMVFARVSSGYKAGGFNARSGGDSYMPEELTSVDAGIKSELFDNRLQLNLSTFFASHTDVQVQQTQAGTGGAQTQTVNAGEAEYLGIEGELIFRPVEALTLSGNVGYVDRDYLEFEIRDPVTDLLVDVHDSAHFVNSPSTTASASVVYDFPATAMGQVSARADYDYRGKMYFNPTSVGAPYNDAIATDSRSLLNLRLSLRDIPLGSGDTQGELALWARNVLDEEYRTFGIDFGALGYAANMWGEPTTWGVDLTVRF